MISTLRHFVLLCLFAGSVYTDEMCDGKPDGIYGTGCRSYTHCLSNVGIVVDCTPHYFNIAKQPEPGCDIIENTPPPCGDQKDCTILPDLSFPRLDDDCESFFTCQQGIDLGTQWCNPGTVFNWIDQLCDWPWNVYYPCGTKEP